jgi:phage virion morphogenesis protein
MSAAIIVDKQDVQIALGRFTQEATDHGALLRICGELMRTSIARTFREEGSPAGSWPALAASTRKKKGYGAGHKLLILSGRLFGSITYLVAGDILTIGTNVIYAAVHQFGSKDWMGGAAGPRTEAMMAAIGAYAGHRVVPFRRYGKQARADKHGKMRIVRAREQGPSNESRFGVSAHNRRQNIPARPFLVFRPEDPDRMMGGVQAYLSGKAVRLGKVGQA